MYPTAIGRIFLDAYNERHTTGYSAQQYFDEVFAPLFFDHPKSLNYHSNTTYFQPAVYKAVKMADASHRSTHLAAWKKRYHEAPADASPIAYPSTDVLATTSGQVTDVQPGIDAEGYVLALIGAALGITVQGGSTIGVPDKEVLLALSEGWAFYRRHLHEMELRPHQVNSWNGHYLAHMQAHGSLALETLLNGRCFGQSAKGEPEVCTANWAGAIYALARLTKGRLRSIYVYNLGQTNTTYGFIGFSFEHITKPAEIYAALFGANALDKRLRDGLYDTELGFRRACALGGLGTQALMPAGLREFVRPKKADDGPKQFKYDPSNQETTLTYRIYIAWIMALLNDNTLWQKAQQTAAALHQFAAGDKALSTKRSNAVKVLLDSSQRRPYVAGLTGLVEQLPDGDALIDAIYDEGRRADALPTDHFLYYLTVVRFCYAVLEKGHSLEGLAAS